jgi:hypothetical protein
MKLVFILFFVVFFSSCSKNKVYLIKQWHLSAGQSTTDLIKSKSLPQYINQIDIYDRLIELKNKKLSSFVIAEGCSNVESYFKSKFNGWNLELLKEREKLGDLDEVLAPVPMKLKAKFSDGINIVCGDDLDLIKKNNLELSNLKGFSGFYEKLKYFKNVDQEKYDKYLKAFKETTDIPDGKDPVLVAKNKTLKALKNIKLLIEQRNIKFLNKITSNLKENPSVVVGGLHIASLSNSLKKLGIDFEVITPLNYPADDEKLFTQLYKSLEDYKEEKVVYFQVPEGFSPDLFPVKNTINKSKLFTDDEWKSMEVILKKHKINPKILFSDLDKDGIRDFTLSTSGSVVVLSAEDNDWDNDKIPNLLDSSIGSENLFIIKNDTKKFDNIYNTKGIDIDKAIAILKGKGYSLISTSDVNHDLLLVKVLSEVIQKMQIPKGSLSTINATKAKVQFGKKVFFSYIPQSKSLEIYPEELYRFLINKKNKEFRSVPFKKFLDGVIIPILIHSFAHELGHAYNTDFLKIAKKSGWSWQDETINSKYLNSFRNKVILDVKYEDMSYKDWLLDHQLYVNSINELVNMKLSDKEFSEKAKDLKWYQKISGKEQQYQVSYLVHNKIPSLYSLSSPKEWMAEIYAACVFQSFYPNSIKRSESIRFELLMGFNPSSMEEGKCQ